MSEISNTDILRAINTLKTTLETIEETVSELEDKIDNLQESVNNLSLPGRDYDVEEYE